MAVVGVFGGDRLGCLLLEFLVEFLDVCAVDLDVGG